jgi:hypothetical protein
MPEFLRSMAVQQYLYGIRNEAFDFYTRKGLTALMTTGDLNPVFDKE